MTDSDPQLRRRVLDWIAADPDSADAAELTTLVEAEAAELSDLFARPLTFGTAGLRGPMRPGPSGMNTAVVRRAAAGLAAHLSGAGHLGRTVVLGYDGRHRSAAFAADSAAVLAAAGFDARLLPEALPTPVLAFAVRRLGAVAGVMVTASHNPPRDNGYKVYGADGAQIVSPTDREIEAAIDGVGAARDIALSTAYSVLDGSVVEDYLDAITGLLVPDGPRGLSVVHTALHGVGTKTVRAAFFRAGFTAPIEVAAQAEPDPAFPTVDFPNPEEPGAMDLAIALARGVSADLIIANDPDADRCAVGVATPDGEWRMLTGDEVGVLLADWLMRRGVPGTYATTIVSSQLLSEMAGRRGVAFAETLTGFKWIVRASDDLAFGYEEALGYAVAPSVVRDKDGISAALVVAELAAHLKASGSSLLGRLQEFAAEYGEHLTRQLSWRVADAGVIAAAMTRARAFPPATLVGEDVSVNDLMPSSDVLIFRTATARAVVRPSGTEPKLKAYLEVRGSSRPALEKSMSALAAETTAALGL